MRLISAKWGLVLEVKFINKNENCIHLERKEGREEEREREVKKEGKEGRERKELRKAHICADMHSVIGCTECEGTQANSNTGVFWEEELRIGDSVERRLTIFTFS